MRANHHALAALDAEILVPCGNLQRDVALLPLRGARSGRCRRQAWRSPAAVAVAGGDRAEYVAERSPEPGWRWPGKMSKLADDALRAPRPYAVRERSIDGGEVLLHHSFAALAIGLLDGLLDLRRWLLRAAIRR